MVLDTAENCNLHANELNAVFNECTGTTADIQCTTVTLPDDLTANVLTVAPPKDPDCDTVALGLNRAAVGVPSPSQHHHEVRTYLAS